MSSAGLAAGADSLSIEVHPCPERAFSDGLQSMDLTGFAQMITQLRPAAEAATARV